jgi:hypothetical protein
MSSGGTQTRRVFTVATVKHSSASAGPITYTMTQLKQRNRKKMGRSEQQNCFFLDPELPNSHPPLLVNCLCFGSLITILGPQLNSLG